MIKEFKEFISRGNVLDLAVGVIIGGAFSKIVSSLVENIFTPIIGLILGGLDFSSLSIKFKQTSIMYGLFIQSVVDFLIIGFSIFMFIKLINSFRKEEEKPNEAPKKSDELKALEEIRDLLKNENKVKK